MNPTDEQKSGKSHGDRIAAGASHGLEQQKAKQY
jgi:hypothetical protein